MRLALLLLVLGGCAGAPPRPLTPAELEIYPEARGMPADVQDYMVRWQGCQHWLGEYGGDRTRRRQIERAVRAACPGIDARGRRVRAAHAGEAEVLARLADYEPLGF
jgi:hypothetical protein